MTAIVIWFNDEVPENPSLWIAADSRISQVNSTLLTDHGAKIFVLPVTCRYPDRMGFYSAIGYHHTFGFSFAGSTLLGQNSVLTVTSLLTNLTAPRPYAPPMQEISYFLHRFLNRAYDEYKESVGRDSKFEAAFFGWCQQTRKHHIFHYHPVLENGVYTLRHSIHTDMNSGYFLYLGEQKSVLKQRIEEALQGVSVPGRPLSRVPRYIIQDVIKGQEFPGIGGDIQLGIADIFGFQPYALVKPRIECKPEAYFSYLGYELFEDITNIGEATFGGLRGMAG